MSFNADERGIYWIIKLRVVRKALIVDWIENKKPYKRWVYRVFLYSRRDLNPHGHNAHRILSPACLPIPPLERDLYLKKNSTRGD